jgi:hypothetical protein
LGVAANQILPFLVGERDLRWIAVARVPQYGDENAYYA